MIFYIFFKIFNIFKIVIICIVAYNYVRIFYDIFQKAKSVVIIKRKFNVFIGSYHIVFIFWLR